MRRARPGRILAVIAVLTAVPAVQDARRRPAAALTLAPIVRVQGGALAKVAGATVSPTLPAASRAGTLLVASLTSQRNASFTAPTGWVKAIGAGTLNAHAEIWYYANNPGGITGASFSNSGSASTAAQLSEWSGVVAAAPLDQTGSTTALLSTSVTPATDGSTTSAGELAVTAAAVYSLLPSTATFTPGSGWTNLGNSGATSSSYQYTADYRTGVAAGTVSEKITASLLGTWAAVVATFKPVPCHSGALTLTTPPTAVTFTGVTLTGTDRTATASAVLTPSEMRTGAAGWNIQATSTTFKNAAGRTLPTTATKVTGATATATSASCDLPSNSIAYPVTLPAGTTAPTAVKVFNAATNTGGGPLTLTLSFLLSVPASAYSGTYTSTWTFTIASGP